MRKIKIENSDDIMSVREAAEFFDIKTGAMYKRAERGIVPSHNVGSRKYFLRSELLSLVGSS